MSLPGLGLKGLDDLVHYYRWAAKNHCKEIAKLGLTTDEFKAGLLELNLQIRRDPDAFPLPGTPRPGHPKYHGELSEDDITLAVLEYDNARDSALRVMERQQREGQLS